MILPLELNQCPFAKEIVSKVLLRQRTKVEALSMSAQIDVLEVWH